MWTYEKKLQYPVRIKTPNARTAKYIIHSLAAQTESWLLRYGICTSDTRQNLTK